MAAKLNEGSLFQDLPSHPVLWVADENARDLLAQIQLPPQVSVLTNRYDVFLAAKNQDRRAIWNDFDLSSALQGIGTVLYRTSKEKPVVHHVINQVVHGLNVSGELRLLGENQGGIKTYQDKTRALFGGDVSLSKSAGWRLAVYEKNAQPTALLPTKDYDQLRTVFELHDQPVFSKPGAFGWDKTDQGSQLLVDTLREIGNVQGKRVLDLGAGYGFLSLWCHALKASWVTATDNNAAAIAACEKNFQQRSIRGRVEPSDAGDGIDHRFDLVVCNPPFHQGFKTDDDLTERFLRHAKRCLDEGGDAWFVVNEFIPLAKKAARHFRQITELAHSGGFKVFCLR